MYYMLRCDGVRIGVAYSETSAQHMMDQLHDDYPDGVWFTIEQRFYYPYYG